MKKLRRQQLWSKIAYGLAFGLLCITHTAVGETTKFTVKPRVASSESAKGLERATTSTAPAGLPSFKITTKTAAPKIQPATGTPNNPEAKNVDASTVPARTKQPERLAAGGEVAENEATIVLQPKNTEIEKSKFNANVPMPEPDIDPADAFASTLKTSPPAPQQEKAAPVATQISGDASTGEKATPTNERPAAAPKQDPQALAKAPSATATPDTTGSLIQDASVPAQVTPVSSTLAIGSTTKSNVIRPWIPSKPVKDHSKLPYVSKEQLASLRLPREIDQRTRAMIKQGTSLAKRGAMYSARQEFLSVLQLVAQAYDSQLGIRYHSKALANGLRALEEADDFATRNSDAAVDFNLKAFIAGHKTPVLKNHATDELLPYVAMQRYYDYARQQLAIAGRGSASASAALYAIGRTETMVSRTNTGQAATGPKPLAYYQSALAIDQRNNPAANELGVMLAQAGKVNEAHNVLAAAARVRPTPMLMNNLAQTRRMMNGGTIRRRPPMSADQISPQMLARRVPVKWVSPNEFSRGSAGPAGALWTQQPKVATRPNMVPAPAQRVRR